MSNILEIKESLPLEDSQRQHHSELKPFRKLVAVAVDCENISSEDATEAALTDMLMYLSQRPAGPTE